MPHMRAHHDVHACLPTHMHSVRTHRCIHCRYEVMPGQSHDFMPDLENLIKTGKVQGTWPAARDEWGLYSSKLETVLLVEVPSKPLQAV